jgi:predicted nucleotidyltransferase
MKSESIQNSAQGSDSDVTPPTGSELTDRTNSLAIPVPAVESSLYRYGVTDPLLSVLVDNPYSEFTIRELSRATDANTRSVSKAVDVLETNGLVTARHEGNKRLVGINRARLSKPDDPVLQIPQPEFQPPVRAALTRIEEDLEDVCGVVVFGSVARGEADRRSDIDLWVLVTDDRATNQRQAHDIANTLGSERFDGDRYEFQILVESIETAIDYSDRLHDVFASGLTLRDSEALQKRKQEVLHNA